MVQLKQISSVEDILPKVNLALTEISSMSVLMGESASYQIAYVADVCQEYTVTAHSDIQSHISLYKIGNVPVGRTVHTLKGLADDNYISKDGGLYPDILYPLEDGLVRAEYYHQGIWVEIDEAVPAGEHRIEVTFACGDERASAAFTLEVLNAQLPPQELKYKVAVHGDCIAEYYDIPVFSQRHWELLEKFITLSAQYGSNMLMPPVFTPPVDTWVGGERLTVQLVDITKDGEQYSFDFSKLERYISICHKAGIRYFFLPSLFTQWGAECAAKFVVREDGVEKKMFGWDVKSTDPVYFAFLRQFLPALTDAVKRLGIEKNVMLSMSDEPFDDEAIRRYKTLNGFLAPLVKDFTVLDSFSSFAHFKESGANMPLIPIDVMADFDGKIGDAQLCVYYCCAQDSKVSNRFIAMPLYRTRCFGYQMYKYDVKMFFHWALNFYHSALSLKQVDPFQSTDADGCYPAGDPFNVYPGADGPIKSTRLVVFKEALQDLRALKLLERYIGREAVIQMLEEITGEITFENCARSAGTILTVRERLRENLRKFIV